MAAAADIVVVGAGVVGLSAARALAASGARVTVLDPSALGGQGSRAAAGVIVPSVRLVGDSRMLELANAGKAALMEDLATLTGANLRRGHGILRPAADEKTRASMEAQGAAVPGFLGRWLPVSEVVALEPALTGAPIAGAFLQDDGCLVDTDGYLTALLHDASARGVEVSLSEGALSVTESSSGVEIRTGLRTLRADRVLVAAGAWSGCLPGLPPLPVRPQRGQIMTVFHPRARLTRIVSGAAYIAPWRNGEVLVGATEEDAGFAAQVTPAGLLHLCATVARLAPPLRESAVMRSWAGLRSITPSGRPLLGRYPGTERVWLASGHGGQGIMTGGLSGRAVAEMLGGAQSAVAAPFDPATSLAAGGAAGA